MTSKFLISLTAFSLALSGSLLAEDELYEEVVLEDVSALEEELVVDEEEASSQQQNRRIAFPKSETAQAEKEPLPKRMKPHFAGVKRPQPKVKTPEEEKKKSTRVKNKWFSSKTHPKVKERVEEEKAPVQLVDDRPHFIKTNHAAQGPFIAQKKPSDTPLEPEKEEGHLYPEAGFQAPSAHVYLTGEWLYWQTRQEGMEFATAKKVDFDFQSGFRAGLGVHLPRDHWDIYVNYTRFTPDASHHTNGSFYPLFLFNASNVTEADAHWKIKFQSLDVEIGRAYYIAESLAFRPFMGLKGAWIDQHAHIDYQGGFVAQGQTYHTQFENDFKGAGPLIGIESNWHLGAGFSLFGDLAAALVVGHFDNKQKQRQFNNAEIVDLNTAFNLVSPTLQMVAGLAWDRNFSHERCHVGLSAGFETQYWWSQNQTEQFTDTARPVYIREKGDLAFYGLTLRGRVDF